MRFLAMGLPMIPKPMKPTLSDIPSPAGDDRVYVPLHFTFEGVSLQHKIVPFALQAQAVERPVLGEAEQGFGGGYRAVDRQLYLPPVHPIRALREPDVRYRRAVPDEHDDGDLPGADAMPPGAFVDLAGLVVGPEPRRQVDLTLRRVLHERGDQDVRAEQVLVLDKPGGRVLRVFEEQGAQHRVAFL